MKKIFTFFAALCAMGTVMAQTIVSTDVEKRNVLIEEFTGVNCQYCPDGHRRANAVCEEYAGHAWAINIHQGSFAAMYTTQWGDALANQYGVQGWPSGVTNRCPNLQDRGEWAAYAAQVRTQDSPVNVAATATINPMTRQLIVNVEMYYTGTQTVSSNFLNVVLLQNNVMGPQTGASTWYPEMIENGQYRHMHMLRDMLTGQWGEEISTIDSGVFIQRTYTYSIPAVIGDVAIRDFNDLQVLAFVTETHKNVLTANEAAMTILPGVWLGGFEYENNECSLDFQPYVTVCNTFDEAVTSWTFTYDGQTLTYDKTVASGGSDTILLPLYTIAVSGDAVQNCATTKDVALTGIVKGGETLTLPAAPLSISFADFNIYTADGPFTARIGLDCYRTEAGVSLVNQSTCQAIWTETGNFGNDWNGTQGVQYISQLPNAGYFDITFNPAEPGLYIFRALDSYGDGWGTTNNTVPSGIWISNADGQFAAYQWGYSYGPSFSQYDIYLNVTSTGDGSYSVGINEVAASVDFSIYPNPATDRLNINCNDAVREVSVIDVTGRTVINAGAESTVNVSGLAAGVYMVRVATENGIGVQKFVKE
ncbi:MAG: Omp28-related outer membrane protein [Bacteroidales bacterium]|nr:Omp28-related outer membrane protein [Bacteroidales bacterium]